MKAAILEECRKRLIETKNNLLNRLSFNPPPLSENETTGDFGDQTARAATEHDWVLFQTRARNQIFEIELALSRIENGSYGICEETGFEIEPKRLLALPWTRWSIEGASAREKIKRLDH